MNKNLKKRLPFIVVAALVLLGVVVFAYRLSVGGDGDRKTTNRSEIEEIEIRNSGTRLTVGKDGTVGVLTEDGLFSATWESGKVGAFYDYILANYIQEGQSGKIVLSGINDELIGIIVEETVEGEEGTTTGGTPPPGGGTQPPGGTPPPGGGGGSGTPPPGGGGGGGSECLYWKISFCVVKRTPSPTPQAGGAEILPPDCGENLQTGKTAIGNELCLSTPTPGP